jgi:hydroxymethylbilane synthase
LPKRSVPSSTSEASEGPVRIATRASPLARWQAGLVARLLEDAGRATELVLVQTAPDIRSSVPLHRFAGKGLFTAEVSLAVIDGRADIAVHSAKDLPSSPELLVEGLVIAAVPERGDPRDALVGAPLADLPPGATVATGSVRRRVQLAWLRPDLGFAELRGNIATRLERRPPRGALVVAVVALQRLDLEEHVAEVLEPATMLPQVGQGALAIECREDDGGLRDLIAAHVDHESSHRRLDAERAFLAALGGGCDAPLGALATCCDARAEGEIRLEGLVASADGHVVARRTRTGSDPVALGREVAAALLPLGLLESPEPA